MFEPFNRTLGKEKEMRYNIITIHITPEAVVKLLKDHVINEDKVMAVEEPVALSVDNERQVISIICRGKHIPYKTGEGGENHGIGLITSQDIKENI